MQNTSYTLYPELEALEKRTIKVDNLHEIYYEVCGNPIGIPVVFLHGGPGSGCNPMQRRFFDPDYYRIVLIDQRGCGRSTPLGSIVQNTTADLVMDIDLIRQSLDIEKWLVFGGSWGSTLALSYALTYPQQVTGLILRGIFLSRPPELSWFLGDVANFYPEVWHILVNYLPSHQRHDVLATYSQMIFSNDATINIPAARAWNRFESAIMRLVPDWTSGTTMNASYNYSAEQDTIEVARARIQIHYIQHHCFVDGEAMLKSVSQLAHIPTIIVQGRYDMVCPPKSAWELSRAMPHAELHFVQEAGHSATEVGIISALVAATEKFKQLH